MNDYEYQIVLNIELAETYGKELDTLKQMIVSTKSLTWKTGENSKTDKMKQYFLNSLFDYLREAVECTKRGYLNAANMLIRAAIENFIILTAIRQYDRDDMADLWYIHSVACKAKQEHMKGRIRPEELAELMGYKFDDEQWKGLKKSLGWLSFIMDVKKINLLDLCNKLDLNEVYQDYADQCEYTHGGSYFQKEGTYLFLEKGMTTITLIYYYLERVVSEWCVLDVHFQKLEIKMDKLVRK